MAPLPTIPNVFQARLVWTSTDAPRPATNVLYFRDIAPGQTATDLRNDINANVTANMWLFPVNTAVISSLFITDLSGNAAGTIFPLTAAAKWTGSGGSDPILQGAAVVSVKSGLRGKAGRGRVYLPWVAELQQTKGALNTANVATCQTAWDAFFAAMLAASWAPCVVHAASNTSTDALQYVVRPNLKTQRRRTLR